MENKEKRLFLSSSFADVATLLPDFVTEELKGKKITFIPTASIPESIKFYVWSWKKALEKLGLIVDELEVSTATSIDISNKLKDNDYIYISGGNTFFLLQELRRTGADKIIVEQINLGKMFIGESAGSIIMSPNIDYVHDLDNCKKAPELSDYSSLWVVNFYPLPHFTNFPFKKSVEKIIAKYDWKLELKPISNSHVIIVKWDNVEIRNQ